MTPIADLTSGHFIAALETYAEAVLESIHVPPPTARVLAETMREAARRLKGEWPQSLKDVAAERTRQIEVEGWTPEHDAAHATGEMARAAAAYANHMAQFHNAETLGPRYAIKAMPHGWPWDREWWKPKDPRRDLVRAAALIVAEIDRWDALAPLAARKEPRG